MESNPYLEARREWDERYADLVLGKRNGKSQRLALSRSRTDGGELRFSRPSGADADDAVGGSSTTPEGGWRGSP